jgi:flagellar motor switch protein FliG
MNVLSDFSIVVDDTIAKKNAKAIKPVARKFQVEENPEKEKRKTPRKTKGKLVEEEHVHAVPSRKRVKAKIENSVKTAKKSFQEKSVEKEYKPLNFETIISLSDAKVKKIIKNVEIETLTAAMKSANKDIREKVEKNLGKRALNTYKEILRQLKTISESEIKKSRKLIEKQIKLLTK